MGLQRPPQSLSEIAVCRALAGAALDAHLREQGGRLAPETVVYLLREFRTKADRDRFELCALLLLGKPTREGHFWGGHCEPLIRKMARHFGLADDGDEANEFRARCHRQMWEAITAGRTEKPFWEERFYLALEGVCLDNGRSMLIARQNRVGFAEDDDEAPEHQRDEQVEGNVLANVDAKAIRAAIRDLPDKVRQAAWLRWVLDYQAASKDPLEVTVASTMHVSDRTVRNYLTRAVQLLEQHPVIKALRSDLEL